MRTGAIRAIIFDLGGVIACEDWDSYGETVWKNLAEFLGMEEKEVGKIFHKYYRDVGLESGKGSETEYFSELAGASPENLSENDVRDYYLSLFYAHGEVLELVRKLSGSYPLYMISNDVASWFDFKVRKFGLRPLFKGLFCSGHIGYVKPDPRIYEYALSKIPENPGECVFIDNLERNLHPAERLGVKTILFRSAGQLREDLGKMGIKI